VTPAPSPLFVIPSRAISPVRNLLSPIPITSGPPSPPPSPPKLNSEFETFFKDHIRKLLLVRGRSRYVSKNNPCVTRIRYLRRIFPDARFLWYVRNPIDHAASVLKQDRLFSDLARDDKRLVRMNKMTGFHEFSPNYVPVNLRNESRWFFVPGIIGE
jgi:hypothetical protein